MNDKITEIKEALAKATPGPWKFTEDNTDSFESSEGMPIMSFGGDCGWNEYKGSAPNDEDTKLISNTPEYITCLLQLVDTQSKALEFYANKENYVVDINSQWEPIIPALEDDGLKAREALSII